MATNRGGKRAGSGRKKKPMAVKDIVGSSRNRAPTDSDREQVKIDVFRSPEPPERLSNEAQAIWRRLCSYVECLKVPAAKDLAAFEQVVLAHEQQDRLTAALDVFELGSIERSRVVAEINSHRNFIRSQQTLFGLDPGSQTQIQSFNKDSDSVLNKARG